MSDKKYDKIEQFFRKRMENADQLDQSWNAPPRGILDGAFAVMDEEKSKRRRGFFWWIRSGLLVTAVFVVGALLWYKIDVTDQKLKQLTLLNKVENTNEKNYEINLNKKESIANTQSNIDQIGYEQHNNAPENGDVSKQNVSNNGINTTQQKTTLKAQKDKARENENGNLVKSAANMLNVQTKKTIVRTKIDNKPERISDLRTKEIAVNQTHERLAKQGSNPEDAVLKSIETDRITKIEPTTEKQIGSSAVSNNTAKKFATANGILKEVNTTLLLIAENRAVVALAILPMSLFTIENTELEQVAEQVIKPKENVSKSIIGYIISGQNFSSFDMVLDPPTDYSLIDYDKSYAGYYVGGGVNIPVSKKLFLDVQTSYGVLKNESVYQDKLSYSTANETTDVTGDVIYRSNISMESPLGQFNSEAKFSKNGQDIADSEQLDNITSIEQRFQLVNLTIGLNYTILKKGRMSLYAGGDLGSNYLFGLDQAMNTKLYYGSAEMMDNSYKVDNKSSYDGLTWTIGGKVGVRYVLSDKLHIDLQGGYERALNSLWRGQPANEIKTYLHKYSTGLSIGYSF